VSHVAIIVPSVYNPLELYPMVRALSSRDHTYQVVSSPGVAAIKDELGPKKFNVHLTTDLLEGLVFDGAVLIAGPPYAVEPLWEDQPLIDFVREENRLGHPIAAACRLVNILCYADAVRGKEVTCYPIYRDQQAVRDNGGTLSDDSVVASGNLVTVEIGPSCALWASAFCDLLETGETDAVVSGGRIEPKLKASRKPIPQLAERSKDYGNA